MTLTQFIKANCANYKSPSCLGVNFSKVGKVVSCTPHPTCKVIADKQPCKYFEECLAPIHKMPHTSQQTIDDARGAMLEYKMIGA